MLVYIQNEAPGRVLDPKRRADTLVTRNVRYKKQVHPSESFGPFMRGAILVPSIMRPSAEL
jgi:hypothetical protein